MKVFEQIFVEREYSCLNDISDVDLVIDCGANVGYSSAYFLSRFPKCKVVAVEPDPTNFAMLKANLTPYHERVTLINSAVWSHPANLKISENKYRDGQQWSTQVRECSANEIPDVQATDIGTLLHESGRNRISILKMDIEGAEAVVFAANYESWLPHIDTIAIELHDDTSFGRGTDIFFNAISNSIFEVSQSGELTICKTIKK